MHYCKSRTDVDMQELENDGEKNKQYFDKQNIFISN